MSIDYRSVIVEQSASMVEVVRRGPLDARVPGCPDWSLAELAVHLGGVQRWAAGIVTTGERPTPDDDPVVAAEAAADFLAAATPEVLAALDAADLSTPCWNFSGDNLVKGFWLRRQALEATMHRWDAESTVSADPPAIDAAVAADVIDEFVHMVVRRVIARAKIDVAALDGDVHLHCTDTPGGVNGEWTFEVREGALHVVTEHRKAAVAARGSASDLALVLYNRIPADRLDVFGDRTVLDRWLTAIHF